MSRRHAGDRGHTVDLLETVYGQMTDAVRPPERAGLPTRAAAWTVRELLLHVLLDAQRALVALASPSDGPGDVDAVTYWRPFRPDSGDGGAAHAAFVAKAAAAYAGMDTLVNHWAMTWPATARAARHSTATHVQTQGHVLRTSDLVHTLLVEATVHYLDLTVAFAAPPPPGAALDRVREVLDGLLGAAAPMRWTPLEHVLKGTGREDLTVADREALGALASRFPLFG